MKPFPSILILLLTCIETISLSWTVRDCVVLDLTRKDARHWKDMVPPFFPWFLQEMSTDVKWGSDLESKSCEVTPRFLGLILDFDINGDVNSLRVKWAWLQDHGTHPGPPFSIVHWNELPGAVQWSPTWLQAADALSKQDQNTLRDPISVAWRAALKRWWPLFLPALYICFSCPLFNFYLII